MVFWDHLHIDRPVESVQTFPGELDLVLAVEATQIDPRTTVERQTNLSLLEDWRAAVVHCGVEEVDTGVILIIILVLVVFIVTVLIIVILARLRRCNRGRDAQRDGDSLSEVL